MKVFNIIFCILFLVAAALQYNDTDPYIWIPIYIYGAILCYLAVGRRYLPTAYLIGIICCLAYAAYFLFLRGGVTDWFQHHHTRDLVQHMQAEKPWIEETREVGGLFIVALALGINWLAAAKRRKNLVPG